MEEKKITGFNTISILAISLTMYASGSLIAPALGALQAAFPDTPFSTIRMIMTSMYLSVCVLSIISGKLSSVISPKTLTIAGLAIYGAMGIVGANLSTVTGLMICRIVMGCGVGLVLPQATGIIAMCYKKERKDKYLGYATGISNFGSMLGSIIGGAAALVSWRYNFYSFCFAFVIMILVIVGVPSLPPVKKEKSAGVPKLSYKTWLLGFGMVLIQVFSLVTPTNMAVFYINEQLGPAGLLGTTMALITGIGVVAGFVLPYVRKTLKGAAPFFLCMITGIGFLVLWQTSNVYTTMLAQILIGFGVGALIPLTFIANAMTSDPRQLAVTNSIMSAGLYLGNFGTSYVQNWIGQISGNADMRFMFLTFAVSAMAIAVIVSLLVHIVKKK